ncbi:hypothetical protein PAAL66ix_28285 [Paenibacillus alvei A6-6i-x]|nr:hypothetical protein PAAL66ix_28285 [Paenibacillus alvei A6-6i-x]
MCDGIAERSISCKEQNGNKKNGLTPDKGKDSGKSEAGIGDHVQHNEKLRGIGFSTINKRKAG